jgi:hypothetical protein
MLKGGVAIATVNQEEAIESDYDSMLSAIENGENPKRNPFCEIV